jgi:hypothetical protein
MLYNTIWVDMFWQVITSDDGRFGALKLPNGTWKLRGGQADYETIIAPDVYLADTMIGMMIDAEEVAR